jgi:hypothetical protein
LLGALVFAPQPQARCSAPRRPLPTRGFYLRSDDRSCRLVSAGWLSADANAARPQRFSRRRMSPSKRAAILAGALRLRATTRTIAPVARKSTRRTAGTSASRMPRIVYPPAPLIAPIMTAAMGVSAGIPGLFSARHREGEFRHLSRSCYNPKSVVFISNDRITIALSGGRRRMDGPEPFPAT